MKMLAWDLAESAKSGLTPPTKRKTPPPLSESGVGGHRASLQLPAKLPVAFCIARLPSSTA